MQRIELMNVLPGVFAGRGGKGSQVWEQKIAFEKGKRYMVSAESGTGKSSLCSYLYGYRNDYSGEIAFDGKDIVAMDVNQWSEVRRRSIAYLPQELRLFPELTAMENVLLKNDITGYKSQSEIESLFAELGIADKKGSVVGKMSIGQQQRVAIIRTLCQPCDFILLDEPVSHLDDVNNAIVSGLIMREARAQGAGVIATSVGNNLKIEVDKEYKL